MNEICKAGIFCDLRPVAQDLFQSRVQSGDIALVIALRQSERRAFEKRTEFRSRIWRCPCELSNSAHTPNFARDDSRKEPLIPWPATLVFLKWDLRWGLGPSQIPFRAHYRELALRLLRADVTKTGIIFVENFAR